MGSTPHPHREDPYNPQKGVVPMSIPRTIDFVVEMRLRDMLKSQLITPHEVGTMKYEELVNLAEDRTTHRRGIDEIAHREGRAIGATREWGSKQRSPSKRSVSTVTLARKRELVL